jgi:hypothetical protein
MDECSESKTQWSRMVRYVVDERRTSREQMRAQSQESNARVMQSDMCWRTIQSRMIEQPPPSNMRANEKESERSSELRIGGCRSGATVVVVVGRIKSTYWKTCKVKVVKDIGMCNVREKRCIQRKRMTLRRESVSAKTIKSVVCFILGNDGEPTRVCREGQKEEEQISN